jgi:O-antigen/teichoic acid export membrane protein
MNILPQSFVCFVREALSSSVLRGTVAALNWQFGAKVVTLVASVYAARCLGPQNLGFSGMILTGVSQAALLINLGQDTLVIREYKRCTNNHQKEDLVSAFFSTRLLLTGLVLFFAVSALMLVDYPGIYLEGLLIAVVIVLFNANTAGWLLTATEKAALTYRSTALSALLGGALVLIFFRPGQRVFSDLYVAAASGILLFLLTWISASFNPLRSFSLRKGILGFRLLWRGRWLALTAIVVYLYTQFDQPLLGYLYSVEELGRYRTATSLTASLNMAFATLPVFYYPRMLEWKSRGSAYFRQRLLFLALIFSVIAILSSIAVFLLSPELYPLLYGPAFSSAAYPFAILFASKMVVLVSGPFGWGLWAMGKDKLVLAILSLAAVVAVVLGVLLIPKFGMAAAASANLTAELFVLFGCFFAFMRVVTNDGAAKDQSRQF